jgi:hypothetical protein
MSDCVLWDGSITNSGYGAASYRGKRVDAHRRAYLIAHGEIPKGLSVLHTCDVKLCINPEHLWLGTQLDNMNDMTEKGRRYMKGPGNSYPGELNPNVKLTDIQCQEIKEIYKQGNISQQLLARKYGVSQGAISYILRKRLSLT